MSNQQTRVEEILYYWERYYPMISNVQLNSPFSSSEEFEKETRYLNNCFNPAMLGLLKPDLIYNLPIELSNLIAYIQKETTPIMVSTPHGAQNVPALDPKMKDEYLQKLHKLKNIF